VNALVSALSDPDKTVAAAKELLDRGFGKAAQAVEVSGPDKTPIQINVGIKVIEGDGH
jgi:hypothetical protein